MPDDLRAAFEYAAQCWYADGMVNGREYGELADALLAVLPDAGHASKIERMDSVDRPGRRYLAVAVPDTWPMGASVVVLLRGEATDA